VTDPIDAATLDFLNWVATRTASYAEALEVWQTSCPRSSVWEDSFVDGLVRLERRSASSEPVVVLTGKGRSIVSVIEEETRCLLCDGVCPECGGFVGEPAGRPGWILCSSCHATFVHDACTTQTRGRSS
jgi:hypothetical protein